MNHLNPHCPLYMYVSIEAWSYRPIPPTSITSASEGVLRLTSGLSVSTLEHPGAHHRWLVSGWAMTHNAQATLPNCFLEHRQQTGLLILRLGNVCSCWKRPLYSTGHLLLFDPLLLPASRDFLYSFFIPAVAFRLLDTRSYVSSLTHSFCGNLELHRAASP